MEKRSETTDSLTPDGLRTLVERRGRPCVSIYMPLLRAGTAGVGGMGALVLALISTTGAGASFAGILAVVFAVLLFMSWTIAGAQDALRQLRAAGSEARKPRRFDRLITYPLATPPPALPRSRRARCGGPPGPDRKSVV